MIKVFYFLLLHSPLLLRILSRLFILVFSKCYIVTYLFYTFTYVITYVYIYYSYVIFTSTSYLSFVSHFLIAGNISGTHWFLLILVPLT